MDLRAMQDQVTQRLMGTTVIRQLMSGQLQKSQYIAYMSDVYSYALHSSIVIGSAANRLVHSHPAMAEYLFRHAAEELGHDRWAASDLADLGLSEAQIAEIAPSSACLHMIGLEYYYACHANPVGLFGWMFVLESLGGRVGGGIAQSVDKVLRLNGKGLVFLQGHGEADAHHSEDLYRVIGIDVRSERDKGDFLRMFAESADSYCAILDGASQARQAA